jgi:hypothetical protein
MAYVPSKQTPPGYPAYSAAMSVRAPSPSLSPSLSDTPYTDEQELRGLSALSHQMSRRLDALRTARATAVYSSTLRGRVSAVGGRIFAAYCVLRFLQSAANVISPSFPQDPSSPTTSYPDVVTRLLSTWAPDGETMAQWERVARHASLALVGLIILSSIRLVLRSVTRV